MFNSESTIKECLTSIPTDCEVVLVDQHSTDESILVAQAARPSVTLIRAGANRGFGAGCNIGAANANGNVLIFLNPDASFSSDSVRILSAAAERENALVGPRIVDMAGHEQTRARYWSRVGSDLAEIFLPDRLAVGYLRRDIPADDGVYQFGGRVPYIQGCCLAISADNFWRAGAFDERLFLYHEEESLARRLENIGVKVVLEPRASIKHFGARSTSQFRYFSASQYYRSKALLYLFFSPRPIADGAIVALWVLLVCMAALTPVRKVIGLRADKGRDWYCAAASGVISGWRRRLVDPPGRSIPEPKAEAE